MDNSQKSFSPLVFLAALGAGGIAVMPFAFLQYTFNTGKGLITLERLAHGTNPIGNEILFYSLEVTMIVFAIIHFFLLGNLYTKMFKYLKTDSYKELLKDPVRNSAIMAPFVATAMSMNVFIGPIRFFIPSISSNLQTFMLPALIVWLVLWALTMRMEIKLLKISFEQSFDVNKISFGWLLRPFALAMVTVTGTGIAALAKDPNIAHTAAFTSLMSGGMGLFLLAVKMVSVFKSHLAADGMPAKQLLPSLLIVLPNITLFAISGFRLGHYISHHHGADMHLLSNAIIVIAFAFSTWYMMFGMSLLKDYFKNHFFKKEFYVSQWGLVCPFVAYAVLGSFFYKAFAPNPIMMTVLLSTMIVSVTLFFTLLRRQTSCSGIKKLGSVECLTEVASSKA